MKETPEEFAKRYWTSLAPHYSEHRKILAYFIAERDAELTTEIRKECADRAIAFVTKEAAGILLEDCYIKIDPDQLRAAIEQDLDDWHRRYDNMLKEKWESGELAELNRLERCRAEKERDALAAYAAKLEKAGDFMRRACPIIIARDNWDAARKEKPGA